MSELTKVAFGGLLITPSIVVPDFTVAFFEFNTQSLLDTVSNTERATEVGTLTYPTSPQLYHGNYWVQDATGSSANRINWDHTMFFGNEITLEWVMELDASATTVKQHGISFYINGARNLEPSILTNNRPGLNVNGTTYGRVTSVSTGNRYYNIMAWNRNTNESILKMYLIDGSNQLSLVNSITAPDVPDFTNLDLDSEVFSFVSFNGLDNFAGPMQSVKISSKYYTEPTV